MTKKKTFVDKLDSIFNFAGKAIELMIEHTDGEIKRIKKKIVHFSVIIGFMMISIVFILTGLAKVLPSLFKISEGLSFIVIGCAIIVILSFYSLIARI
ncbi:hypothetical protein GF327_06190 [Candidatus Woesearchaeota archaeon]|nr:hypothetical protein [Candidatus Woesearchaeota archaeon]